ncbi:MAG TPA: response regulator [Candidatus Eisenbacteria bacterium]
MSKPRILIAEDETNLRDVLRLQLTVAGYEVVEAADGQAALHRVRETVPDLVLLDVMMPHLDGFEVCRRLRASYLTRHIPIIMLTAKTEVEDRLEGLHGGANDYITKPWEFRELQARVRNALEWSKQQRSANPLTGLPGNQSIDEELRRRIGEERPFALLQIDIDSFKAFNDQYGYARGDEAIRALARILVDNAQSRGGSEDFVGHIGGDDFLVLTRPERADELAEDIVAGFDRVAASLYDEVDRARGYIEVANRQHVVERFPIMSLTIALVSTDRVPASHQAELIDIANELKAHGKTIPGSVVVGERRSRSDPDPGDAAQDVA